MKEWLRALIGERKVESSRLQVVAFDSGNNKQWPVTSGPEVQFLTGFI
jgi:hypothetical protein